MVWSCLLLILHDSNSVYSALQTIFLCKIGNESTIFLKKMKMHYFIYSRLSKQTPFVSITVFIPHCPTYRHFCGCVTSLCMDCLHQQLLDEPFAVSFSHVAMSKSPFSMLFLLFFRSSGSGQSSSAFATIAYSP